MFQYKGWRTHYNLKWKKKFPTSDGGKSMQILPSIRDRESGVMVRGGKVFRSSDLTRPISICMIGFLLLAIFF